MKYFVEKILQQKKRKNHLPESRRTASSSRAVLPLRRRGPARVRRSTAHPVPRAAADPASLESRPSGRRREAGGAAAVGEGGRRSRRIRAKAAGAALEGTSAGENEGGEEGVKERGKERRDGKSEWEGEAEVELTVRLGTHGRL